MYQLLMESVEPFIAPGASALLVEVSRLLAAERIKPYLVGGFVRDMFLHRETADIDIAVTADAPAAASGVAEALGGKFVLLDRENGVARVVLPHRGEIDFSTIRDGIEQDLARRDFTIDAMALELTAEAEIDSTRLIDPCHGRDDLQKGIIRAVSRSGFQSDGARLLRAVRMAAELGFTIESETEALIREDGHLISAVAGERVREELLRLLALPRAGRHLEYMDDLGLLTAIVPELEAARGVSQPFIHHWNVLEHSIQTVAAVDFLLRQGEWDYGDDDILAAVPWTRELREYFARGVGHGSTTDSLLKLAALLHDIAKPQTKSVDDDGRARFTGHAGEGAEAASRILERLRFSAREARTVEMMVKHHLRPGQMSQQGMPSHRAIYRYFRDTGEAGIGVLFLNLADHLATRGPVLDTALWQEHNRSVEYVLEQHSREEAAAPPRLIDGHDLLNTFGLEPGPRVGEILEAVREAQAAGEVNTRSAALDYAGRLLAHPGPPPPPEQPGEK